MLSDLRRWNDTALTVQLLGQPNHQRAAIQAADVAAIRILAAANTANDPENDGGMRYDGVDIAEWQLPDPVWSAMGPHRMLVTRVCDGSYYDPTFASSWQKFQDQPAPYKGFYVLPDPRLGWKRQGDLVKAYFDRAGVPFGAPGHFYSIDDEPTPTHGQFNGGEMRSFRSYLEDIFQREELHYVGLYNGNYGFIRDEGWQLWGPWPLNSNGALPSWTTNLVAWQWGVAGPGEVWGFPNADVDVNMIMNTAVLDRLSGRTGGAVTPPTPTPSQLEGLFDMLTQDQQAQIFNQVNAVFHMVGGVYPTAGVATVSTDSANTLALLKGTDTVVRDSFNRGEWTGAAVAALPGAVTAAIAAAVKALPAGAGGAALSEADLVKVQAAAAAAVVESLESIHIEVAPTTAADPTSET